MISRLGGPEVLEIRDMPEPTANAGQSLVQVETGGINFADFMTASGGYPGTPKPPLIAGREFCGTRSADGQRVMGYLQWAAFAERVAAPAQLLWPVPQGWSAEEGAAFANGLLKQPARVRSDGQRIHRKGTGALAKDGDVSGISSEVGDVCLHPEKCRNHVHQPVVAGMSVVLLRQFLAG